MNMDAKKLKITNPLQKEHIKMLVKDSEGLMKLPSITSFYRKEQNEKKAALCY